jgi:hypothetical protein
MGRQVCLAEEHSYLGPVGSLTSGDNDTADVGTFRYDLDFHIKLAFPP